MAESGGRSSPSPAASPEFEFWMVGKNPSAFPSPALLTADELFSGGVVLPLHTLQAPSPAEEGGAEAAQPLAESGIAPTPDLPAVTFKWKDIFKAGGGGEAKERKKTERRVSGNAELININIWPFSRSRSAGHSHSAGAAGPAGALSRAGKPNPSGNATANSSVAIASAAPASAPAPAPRKVSSAPCSRSNSRGESGLEPAAIPAAAVPTSMLRRLVPGHGRTNNNNTGAAGIRLGRPSPVWQLRRNKLQQTAAEQKQASAKKKADKAASASASAATPSVGAPAAGCRNNAEGGGEEGPNPPPGLFGIRTFFSKKVY